jgi:hypothetical protein
MPALYVKLVRQETTPARMIPEKNGFKSENKPQSYYKANGKEIPAAGL